MTELMGPDEVANLLCVQRNTIVVWRRRGVMPDPVLTLSAMPIWLKSDIEQWAKETGRAVLTS